MGNGKHPATTLRYHLSMRGIYRLLQTGRRADILQKSQGSTEARARRLRYQGVISRTREFRIFGRYVFQCRHVRGRGHVGSDVAEMKEEQIVLN